jgi:prepilin-type N-terminal cleavage/methylation domain-containing protein
MRHDDEVESGFTLVEMLVVIAIIAILSALLFPVLIAVKDKARQTSCLNNLRQINLGVRMYSDDSNDKSPEGAIRRANVYVGYKELMKNYVGLKGVSSAQDRLFACPADSFYYDYDIKQHGPYVGYVAESLCSLSNMDYSSYTFNAGNLGHYKNHGTNFVRPGIAGLSLSSIKHPARTILVAECPAIFPYSWHKPKKPFGNPNTRFNNALDMVSFVDGHVSRTKMYWQGTNGWIIESSAGDYDPPDGYDYQWSGN